MKLKDYPKEIQELIVKRHKEHCKQIGSKEWVSPEKEIMYLFILSDNIEGYDFWTNIAYGNLQPFYDKYPVPDNRVKK